MCAKLTAAVGRKAELGARVKAEGQRAALTGRHVGGKAAQPQSDLGEEFIKSMLPTRVLPLYIEHHCNAVTFFYSSVSPKPPKQSELCA